MARATFVKKALKDNPVAKRGESYWWWSFRFGGKHYSKERPKPSQLTQSEYLSSVYALQEEISVAVATTQEELETLRDGWVDEINRIGEECQEKFDNMPEGLQQGDTGQMLEERVSNMENWASELEGVDCEIDDEVLDEVIEDQISSKLEELQQCSSGE